MTLSVTGWTAKPGRLLHKTWEQTTYFTILTLFKISMPKLLAQALNLRTVEKGPVYVVLRASYSLTFGSLHGFSEHVALGLMNAN